MTSKTPLADHAASGGEGLPRSSVKVARSSEGPQQASGCTKLVFRLVAHGAVVRSSAPSSAALGRLCLRCERHDRQLSPTAREFGPLSQCGFAAATGFEDNEHAFNGPAGTAEGWGDDAARRALA